MGVYGDDDSGAGDRVSATARRLNAAVVDALTANLAVIDADGEIVATNKSWNLFAAANGAPVAACNYLHFNYLNVCDKAALSGDESAGQTAQNLRAVLRGEAKSFACEYRCDAPDVCRWFLMRATPVLDGSGSIVVSHEDITKQRRADQALNESEAKFRSLFSSMMEGVAIHQLVRDPGGKAEDYRIIDANPAYSRQCGVDGDLARGALASGLYGAETAPYLDIYSQVVETGETRTFETKYEPLGRHFRISSFSLGQDRFGTVFEDITERKTAEEAIRIYSEHLEEMVLERTTELQKAQGELLRKDRLATLGQFAGSVGHELRNPLGIISNAVYFLKAVLQNPDDRTKEYLEMIAREVRNSEKIISDLLEISRNRPAEKRLVSVHELVNDAVLRQPSWEGVELQRRMPENLPSVFVDSRQMVQVIDNLISNAIQSMPEGGRLVLSACQEEDAVVLSVGDTGSGMPRELLGQIFDPLVTTKARGIGLGLTLSKRLAELNGATLEVESEEGRGSCFRIVLAQGGRPPGSADFP